MLTAATFASVQHYPGTYDVPAEYHVAGYRYAYVNDRVVLVEPRTQRIVEIE